MISVCFLFKILLPRGGSYPSTVIPTGAKHRIQSPVERWPRVISTDRPEMESRPYEFLLQSYLLLQLKKLFSAVQTRALQMSCTWFSLIPCPSALVPQADATPPFHLENHQPPSHLCMSYCLMCPTLTSLAQLVPCGCSNVA